MAAQEDPKAPLDASHLEPPPQPTRDLEDSGAEHSSATIGSDTEQFVSAREGADDSPESQPRGRSRPSSPVPRTKVEKVDDEPSYGDVPQTQAYEKRTADAIPDEISISSRSPSREDRDDSSDQTSRPQSPSVPVPRTVVEKVDPDTPSYGDEPDTEAYKKRTADAVPDQVFKAPEDGESQESPVFTEEPETTGNAQDDHKPTQPIPQTLVSRVDTLPTKGGKGLHKRSPSDAEPDAFETLSETGSTSSPNRPAEEQPGTAHQPLETQNEEAVQDSQPTAEPVQEQQQDDGDDFDDDFDDFTAGDANAADNDDEFGDFDEFQESTAPVDGGFEQQEQVPPVPAAPEISFPPILDFDDLDSLSTLLETSQPHLDVLFPAAKNISSLPQPPPIPDSSTIFTTDRSRSLWSQLVAPPPLQPPNWVKSRIRRLFLISLGVPVDLDQILPAKKQKKLVLDSKHFGRDGLGRSNSLRRTDTGGTTAPGAAGGGSDKGSGISRSQTGPGSSSTGTTATTTSSRRRRGPPPPPDLDLTAVQRLSSTTDEALNGLTDEELKEHVALLEEVTQTASKVLEYWVQMRDGQVSEKTAFEGVIENLVKHARQVRK